MTSYPYGQGYHGSAGQTPGAPPGSYYAGQQYGGGGHPGQPTYGGPAPGAPYGPPLSNSGYGQQVPGGAAPGGYGQQVPGGAAPGGYGQQVPGGAAPGGYGQQVPGGSAPGGPGGTYGGHAPGGPYGGPGTNSYGSPQQGQYGQRPAANLPPGVDPEAFNWFHTVDTDRSGYITLKELKQALVNSNWSTFNDETCIMMFNMFDKSQSGRIDMFGFSSLWTFLQQWKNLFQQFDRDRSGSISQGELHQALSQMGYNFSPQFIQQIMSRHSVRSANPGLQLDRFIHICTQLQSMTEAFRDKDTQRAGSVKLSYDDFLTIAVGRLL